MPNFLSVETKPFEPETYEDEVDEEETLDEEGRARWECFIGLLVFASRNCYLLVLNYYYIFSV